MKSLILFFISFIITNSYASAEQPVKIKTDLEKFNGLPYLINQGTLVSKLDYISSTELKPFEDYDFTVESAPCTVLGDNYTEKDATNTIYSIVIDEQKFQFMCRQVVGMKDPEFRRLYMLGSNYDCLSRPFDFTQSEIEEYKKLGDLCKGHSREVVVKNVDYAYLELFHPEKYYLLSKNFNN